MKRSIPPKKGIMSSFDSEIISNGPDAITVKVVYVDYRPVPAIGDSRGAVEWAAVFEVTQKYYADRGQTLKFPKNGPKWSGKLTSVKQISFDQWEAIVQVKRIG